MKKAVYLLLAPAVLAGTLSCKKNTNPNPPATPALTCQEAYFYSDTTDSMTLGVGSAITANADGINDIYRPVGRNVQSYSLKIYDSQGKNLLFSTTDIAQGWDGRVNGQKMPQGNYKAELSFAGKSGTAIAKSLTFVLYDHPSNTCLTKDASNCKFSDQLDPTMGFIYPTNEKICK